MIEFKDLTTYWLDKDTFVFYFKGGNDGDNDTYSYLCEYHADEDKFVFEKWYEYDTTDSGFTDEQKEYIIGKMKECIGG